MTEEILNTWIAQGTDLIKDILIWAFLILRLLKTLKSNKSELEKQITGALDTINLNYEKREKRNLQMISSQQKQIEELRKGQAEQTEQIRLLTTKVKEKRE